MKRYEGQRTIDGCSVKFTDERGRLHALPPRRDLMNHSPNGFEWGYSGSGPAQLALAICAHALQDDHRAVLVHQDFKFKVISGLEGDSWWITHECVLQQIENLETARELLRANFRPEAS